MELHRSRQRGIRSMEPTFLAPPQSLDSTPVVRRDPEVAFKCGARTRLWSTRPGGERGSARGRGRFAHGQARPAPHRRSWGSGRAPRTEGRECAPHRGRALHKECAPPRGNEPRPEGREGTPHRGDVPRTEGPRRVPRALLVGVNEFFWASLAAVSFAFEQSCSSCCEVSVQMFAPFLAFSKLLIYRIFKGIYLGDKSVVICIYCEYFLQVCNLHSHVLDYVF